MRLPALRVGGPAANIFAPADLHGEPPRDGPAAMTLRDRARAPSPTLSPAAEGLGAAIRDSDAALPERLAALDRLVALEVGDTALHRARGLERHLGIRELYLKYEGDNPTGTQKDRIAFAQVRDALARGATDVALATCGNYGVAVALACRTAGLTCRIYVPAGYHTERGAEMERLGAHLHRLPGSYEEVVAASSALAAEAGWYDANPGGANAALQLAAYAAVGREIAAGLPGRPLTAVAVPVSNGTLLAGTYRGLAAALPQNRLPRLLAASSTRKNPIVESWRARRGECRDLDPAAVRETAVNEPLINWHAFDGQDALDAVYATGGAAYGISDRDLRDAAALVGRLEGYRVLPASTAGLVALLREHEALRDGLPEASYVAVLTARN